MSFTVADLLSILDVEPEGRDAFRGRSPEVGWQRIFGGLVVAQGLAAAARTAPGRPPHSLHGYFMRPGDPSVPIDYAVDRWRDGRSFSTRQCVASQRGKPIFALSASFQDGEAGLDHQAPMPDVPGPETLPDAAQLVAAHAATLPQGLLRYLARERPVDLRAVDVTRYTTRSGEPLRPVQHVWMRTAGPLPDDPSVHRTVLAYMSDMSLLDTALLPHGLSIFEPGLQVASLDHALWFHRPFRADGWLLYAQDSPSASGARGLTRGSIFAQDGRLVASVSQEGLIRRSTGSRVSI